MVRKIAGGFLLFVGVLIGFILLTYGGPVFPHIIGPIVFTSIGAGLLWLQRPLGRGESAVNRSKRM